MNADDHWRPASYQVNALLTVTKRNLQKSRCGGLVQVLFTYYCFFIVQLYDMIVSTPISRKL